MVVDKRNQRNPSDTVARVVRIDVAAGWWAGAAASVSSVRRAPTANGAIRRNTSNPNSPAQTGVGEKMHEGVFQSVWEKGGLPTVNAKTGTENGTVPLAVQATPGMSRSRRQNCQFAHTEEGSGARC